MSNIDGVYGIPGAGKSTVSRLVAATTGAVNLDNDVFGYPPSLRLADAARLGYESIDDPRMGELNRAHAIALFERARNIALQGKDVVLQSPAETIGIKSAEDKPSAVESMQAELQLAGCTFSAAYLIPLPSDIRGNIISNTLTPQEVEEVIGDETVLRTICDRLSQRYLARADNGLQSQLDAPKINNMDFVRDRFGKMVQSMSDSNIPGIPVFLNESPDQSAERVIEVYQQLRSPV